MTSLGPLTYRRARYRSGAIGSSPVPVDESLGLVDDYLTRPAAQLGLLMMGHCTAREAAAFFAKIGGMTPSVSTLQRLTRTMHERWETLGPETLDIRDAEGVPHEAVSASASLDGVMVPLPGRRGSCRGLGASPPAARFPSTTPGARRPLSRPHAGERQVTLKAQLASEVAHIRQLRSSLSTPPPPTIGPSWRPCRPKPRSSTSGMPANISERHPTMRWPPTGSRGTARFCVTTPVASIKVIRALRGDSAKPDRAERTGTRLASTASACATSD